MAAPKIAADDLPEPPPNAPGPVTFAGFLGRWAEVQGLSTPRLHADMAGWLQERWRLAEHDLLLTAFRDSGKSTIVGLFCAWLLREDPDLRIMVLSADEHLAKKMVRTVRRVVETHPWTRHLKPVGKVDLWGADAFTVLRPHVRRDPSMQAKGVTANYTGSHAEVVVCDDVEVPNTCDTRAKRDDLRRRLEELVHVLCPGGTLLYVGTPHTSDTIYAPEPTPDRPDEPAFLGRFQAKRLPLFEADGVTSRWPERFTEAAVERIRRLGPNKFKSQMLLDPVPMAEGRLAADLLRRYEGEVELRTANGVAEHWLGEVRLLRARGWWDPALGASAPDSPRPGDGSVVVALFEDAYGNAYIHRIQYLVVPQDKNPAAAQCALVAAFCGELGLPRLVVEKNGIGGFLPGSLKAALIDARVRDVAVGEANAKRCKDDRIMDAFDTYLATGRLYAHASVFASPLMRELREWRPECGGRDDGLDAVAGALADGEAKGPGGVPKMPTLADTKFNIFPGGQP